MGAFLGIIFDVLVGRNAPLKRYLAAIGVVVLAFIAFVTFFGYGASPHPESFYLVVAVISAITAIGLFVQLVTWRVRGGFIAASCRQSGDAYAIIKELRASGILILDNSPLVMADWSGVSLKGADLHNANFNKTGLEGADLSHANLTGANLRSARLNGANLSESNLTNAVLCYATLQSADLQDAQLANADLTAADLSHALLQSAHLEGARCDEHTILPDGSKWTCKTNWAQFVATSQSGTP